MTDGIRTAKDGDDVSTFSPQDLNFSSEFISPKLALQGSGQVTTDGSGNATVTIQHGLTYSPVYLVYINPCFAVVNDSFDVSNSYGLIDNNFAFVTSFPQQLRLDIQQSAVNKVHKYVYFIFVEPAANG